VLIVASVSCIYGLGSPEAYNGMLIELAEGLEVERNALLRRLVEIQYQRNDVDFHRGTFRVRGDVVEIFPAYEEKRALRVTFFGDEIEEIAEIDPLRGIIIDKLPRVYVFPASHYVATSRPWSVPSRRFRRICACASASCAPPTSWSRRSAWSSAPCSTSR
jgi:excinuclease ABC subunit B